MLVPVSSGGGYSESIRTFSKMSVTLNRSRQLSSVAQYAYSATVTPDAVVFAAPAHSTPMAAPSPPG